MGLSSHIFGNCVKQDFNNSHFSIRREKLACKREPVWDQSFQPAGVRLTPKAWEFAGILNCILLNVVKCILVNLMIRQRLAVFCWNVEIYMYVKIDIVMIILDYNYFIMRNKHNHFMTSVVFFLQGRGGGEGLERVSSESVTAGQVFPCTPDRPTINQGTGD